MQRNASFKKSMVLMLVVLLFGLIATVSTALAADDGPRITAFSTSLSIVDKTTLANRTAPVPVSWTTERRPVYANLFFEQILPDGSVINVELPRLIPWVNSNGNGVAAPSSHAMIRPKLNCASSLSTCSTIRSWTSGKSRCRSAQRRDRARRLPVVPQLLILQPAATP